MSLLAAVFGSWVQDKARGQPWPSTWSLPHWQVHRGYRGEGARENTLESMLVAASHGAEMCELDLRLTRDGVPVLFHDVDGQRVWGFSERLDSLTYGDLAKKAQVTTLRQLLRHPKAPAFLNLELKSEQVWNESLERRVARVVSEEKAEDRVLFSSFNPISLWKMQALLPNVPRALLVAPDLHNPWLREMALLPLLKLHALHLEHSMLGSEFDVGGWQEKGFRLAVWTVNEPARVRELQSWGVDSIISDELP